MVFDATSTVCTEPRWFYCAFSKPQAVLRVWVVCNEYQVDIHDLVNFRLYNITFSREMSMERQ